MMYCHNCLKKIHFWESRAEGRHIKCLPVEERCKYYHIQRDMSISTLLALFVVIPIVASTLSVLIHYVAIVAAILIFLFCNIIAYGIRKKEEEERKAINKKEKRKQ